MIGIIIKQEIKNYLRNPLYYIGAILVFIEIYAMVSPYLQIHYFASEKEIEKIDEKEISDADIQNGYILADKEEQKEMTIQKIKDDLITIYEMSEEETNQAILKIREECNSIEEIDAYMNEQYSYCSVFDYYRRSEIKKVDAEEVNMYIKEKCEEKSYTYYISKKFTDFCGLFFVFYSMIILAFLFIRDTKKDIYELLHTKPIKAKQYIIGKVMGGMMAMLSMLALITFIFDILAMINGIKNGFPISFFDMWKDVVIFILPSIFMVISIYTFIAIVFKNPLPAVPLLFIHMIYSNMGRTKDGVYDYYGNFFSVFTRFPGRFFEVKVLEITSTNIICLIVLSVLLIFISTYLWKRRRL